MRAGSHGILTLHLAANAGAPSQEESTAFCAADSCSASPNIAFSGLDPSASQLRTGTDSTGGKTHLIPPSPSRATPDDPPLHSSDDARSDLMLYTQRSVAWSKQSAEPFQRLAVTVQSGRSTVSQTNTSKIRKNTKKNMPYIYPLSLQKGRVTSRGKCANRSELRGCEVNGSMRRAPAHRL